MVSIWSSETGFDEARRTSIVSYIGTLINEDRKRWAEARLEALLVEGLDSGDPQPLDAAEWESIRQEVRERIGTRLRPA